MNSLGGSSAKKQPPLKIDMNNMKRSPQQTQSDVFYDRQKSPESGSSPVKSKTVHMNLGRKKKDSGHSRSPRDEMISNAGSNQSPVAISRRKRKDQRKSDPEPFVLSQDQEFIAAQQQNIDQFNRVDRRVDETLDKISDLMHKMDRIAHQVKHFSEVEQNAKLDQLKKKLIMEVVHEQLTPFKRNLNVDLKRLRGHLEECLATTEDHQERHMITQHQLDLINVTILRQLKNTDNEKQLLNRELNRMQQIDRVKVQNARNSFFNPDTGSILPTVDTLFAATTTNSPSGCGAGADLASLDNNMWASQSSNKNATSVTVAREVVTNNELKGHCERMGSRPSQRKRIIITRSQDTHPVRRNTNLAQKRFQFTANNTHRSGFQQNLNDSIMSTTSNYEVQRITKTQGNMLDKPKTLQPFGTINIQETPPFPDANARLRDKLNQKHVEDVKRKKQLARKIEDHRQQVLDSFNIGHSS